MSFWDHLEQLRASLIRMLIAATAMAVVAFCLRDWLFAAVLAPTHSDFFVYRILGMESMQLSLINVALTEQMMVHIKVALIVGIFVASPYLLYVIFHFISPALYEQERRYGIRLTVAAYLMFVFGVALSYCIIFPFTLRFLATYQVSSEVTPMLTISSYIDTLVVMSLLLGIVSELPVLSWILAKIGVLRAEVMRQYRRHAIVVVLIVAAVITPTTDPITLFVVALPIWLLYEVSIVIIRNS